MATAGDFAAFLDQIGEDCDADLHTRTEVAKRKEAARQDFLLEFEAAKEASILPVFEEAAGRATKAFHLSVRPSRGKDTIELTVTIVRSAKETVSGRLQYRADLTGRTVTREEQIEGGLIDHNPVRSLKELTTDEVRGHVAAFIQRVRQVAS